MNSPFLVRFSTQRVFPRTVCCENRHVSLAPPLCKALRSCLVLPDVVPHGHISHNFDLQRESLRVLFQSPSSMIVPWVLFESFHSKNEKNSLTSWVGS